MQNDLTPDPVFVDGLEWQLRRELRRGSRLGGRPGSRTRQVLGLAVVALASGLLGVAAMAAAQQARAARRAEPIVRAMEARSKVAAQLRDSAATALAKARALHKAGVESMHGVTKAEARLAEAEALAVRAALDLEEVLLSNQPPRDGLSAPKLEGRDFVSERLRATLTARAHLHTHATSALEQARTHHRQGVIGNADVAVAELQLELTEIDVRETFARLEVRDRFLLGKATNVEVEHIDLLAPAEYRVLRAEARKRATQTRQDALKRLHAHGLVSNAELKQMEDELAEIEWELTNARAEAAALDHDGESMP